MGIEKYLQEIEARISRIEAESGGPESLYAPIFYGMAAGGKRLRPALLMMTAEACGGSPEKALDPAVGVEMFHNFTLLHDDVMDNSPVRRGRSSVFGKWGTEAAILSGDTMLTMATELVAKVDDRILRSVLDCFNRMAIDVYEGQAYDMDFEKRDDVTIDEYIGMISLKTGALIGGSAKIGAMIGGAGQEVVDAMYDYGMNLGIAFQIQDDFLDVYGDSATFGKPIGGDINNNKKTYLLVKTLQKDSTGRLRESLSMSPGPDKVRTVTGIYDSLGLGEECRCAIDRYTGAALEALRRAGLPEDQTRNFEQLAHRLTGRDR